ncbi:MAG TPA: hypothetical protein D7H96_06175 [Candidatus Poseidoniales archaeon]|nr:MAG TPA: hypothetical protein D7H96_06175 [Candidatus Poseidoniales archaeon]
MTPCFVLNAALVKAALPPVCQASLPSLPPTSVARRWAVFLSSNQVRGFRLKACLNKAFHHKACPNKAFHLRA